jgi:hypothetical protein
MNGRHQQIASVYTPSTERLLYNIYAGKSSLQIGREHVIVLFLSYRRKIPVWLQTYPYADQ